MPSSKCQQVSLTLGELYNDIRTAYNLTGDNKYMLKILADYAKRFDAIIEMAEKTCYDKGYDDALAAQAKIDSEIKKPDQFISLEDMEQE